VVSDYFILVLLDAAEIISRPAPLDKGSMGSLQLAVRGKSASRKTWEDHLTLNSLLCSSPLFHSGFFVDQKALQQGVSSCE
jgi:hypothetical protein